MYSFNQISKGVRNPELLISELNRVVTHTINQCAYNENGVDIFEKDWDNLVILDACRYDFFKEQSELEGRTNKCHSRGTTSREFIRGNFTNRRAYDTVYVSANPWFLRLQEEINAEVHAYVNLHTDEIRDAVEGLTTRPETVTEYATKAANEYPNKRLIIHYLQPHQPFLGEFGQRVFDYHKDTLLSIKQSDVSHEDVIRAYRENLDLVLGEVSTLLESLQGRTVITSDHGELLGERQQPIPMRHYGHPCGVYVEELLEVPWHVIENDSRKDVRAEEPDREIGAETDAGSIEDQLSALGYRV